MTVTRSLQRLVFPTDRDTDVFALYVDAEHAALDADKYEIGANRNAQEMNAAQLRQSTATGASIHPDQILGRRSIRIPLGERLSFGTYFNAFPAAYWRRWSIVTDVTLTVTLAGRGAAVTVYRSMANGRSQRVDSGTTDEGGRGTFTFELPLKPFADGGWYWFDVVAGDERRRRRGRRVDRAGPRGPRRQRHHHGRHHHHEPPRLLRQAARPDR